MSEAIRYKLRGEGLATQTLDDEVVVLDLKSSSYLLLNPTGATLWPLLTEGATLEALVGHLVNEFSVDLDVAGRDAAAFVADLERLGLLANG